MIRQDFLDDVNSSIREYEKTIEHFAARTHQMIEKLGAVEALSRLMISPDLQKGFQVLRDNGQLDITFEAIVVRYFDLFETDIVDAAKWRLDNAGDLFI